LESSLCCWKRNRRSAIEKRSKAMVPPSPRFHLSGCNTVNSRVSLSYPEMGVWKRGDRSSNKPTRVYLLWLNPDLRSHYIRLRPLLKPDCPCALQRKAKTVTAFVAKRSVLSGPVCLEIITKYGHFSRISEVEDPTFSAVQTAWRRKRDSNSRYGFVALSLDVSVSCR
jgi:hypothetical protein